MPRVVQQGDVVKLRFSGKTKEKGTPVSFYEKDITTITVGAHGIPALSEACLGLGIGDSRTFSLAPGETGHPAPDYDPRLVAEVDVSRLPKEGRKVGVTLLAGDRPCRVSALRDNKATLDMNDPVAGQTLIMTVKIQGFAAASDAPVQSLFKEPRPGDVPSKTFTHEELLQYDGKEGRAILIAVRGYVIDVSEGKDYYGPGGAYSFMAGHDATLALARFSLNPQLLDQSWDGLTKEEEATLAHYWTSFITKYSIKGTLASSDHQKEKPDNNGNSSPRPRL